MQKSMFCFLSFLIMIISTSDVLARRGCCSWHGGVCGCSESGRQICCDGTLSPSCVCSGGVRDKANPQSSKQAETAQKIKVTKMSDSKYCLLWQEIYEKSAIMKGAYENIEKVKFINQYSECQDLWMVVSDMISFCHDKGCAMQFMMHDNMWNEINAKIDNLYRYLAKVKV